MKITPHQLDLIGQLSDKAENLVAASSLPMPDKFHKDCLVEGLKEIKDQARELYKELGGEAYD